MLLLNCFSRELLGSVSLLQCRIANLARHGVGGLAIEAWCGDDCGSETAISDSMGDEWLKVSIERACLWVFNFLRQRVQIIRLVGGRPVDCKSGALREHGMNNHDGAAVAVEERMTVRKVSHDLAGLCLHERRVLSLFE